LVEAPVHATSSKSRRDPHLTRSCDAIATRVSPQPGVVAECCNSKALNHRRMAAHQPSRGRHARPVPNQVRRTLGYAPDIEAFASACPRREAHRRCCSCLRAGAHCTVTSLKTWKTLDHNARRHLSDRAYTWLMSQELLTAEEIGRALGVGNPGPTVRRWRSQGKLVGIRVSSGHVYPAIQIDLERKRIRPDIARSNTSSRQTCWERIEAWASLLGQNMQGRQSTSS
jgi:hypothetical protein